MQTYLEEQGNDIWDAVENGMYVPISVFNGVGTSKIKSA